LRRRKQGFSIPLGAWLRGPLRDLVRTNLSGIALRDLGLFNVRAIESMLDDHERGVRNYETQLWALLVFVIWHRMYMRLNSSLAFGANVT